MAVFLPYFWPTLAQSHTLWPKPLGKNLELPWGCSWVTQRIPFFVLWTTNSQCKYVQSMSISNLYQLGLAKIISCCLDTEIKWLVTMCGAPNIIRFHCRDTSCQYDHVELLTQYNRFMIWYVLFYLEFIIDANGAMVPWCHVKIRCPRHSVMINNNK